MSLGVISSGVSPPTDYFQSFSQKIATSIFISVENTTTLTNVGSLRQRFLDNFMAKTTLLTGVLRWYSNDNFAKYLPIIFQPFKKLSPCCIIDTFGKTMIFNPYGFASRFKSGNPPNALAHHITHLQVFKHHQIARFDHASCQFHGKIFTLALNLKVFSP